MSKGRLEAFSDAVIAILMTIMVLELQVPHEPTLDALRPVVPVFLGYVLSFLYLAIYWNNHHHLFQAVHHIHGSVLWANIHLLFWLSLIPFTTAWMGEVGLATWPVALYGGVLLLAGFAYYLLAKRLVSHHGADSPLVMAIGRDVKGKLSLVLYAVALPVAFFLPAASVVIYIVVALMWFVPDRRIEREIQHPGQ